ncbi:MAG: hypothetical protein WCO93_04780 [bacterium]
MSCNKELNVNADWKDITVVYGLLDQNDTLHYIKITKAFLGPGDAMQFAQIPDSSNYPDKLDVKIEEWDGTTLKKEFACDTVTIHNKEAGDSIFYFPDQLMYYTHGALTSGYTYKLKIKNRQTGNEISAQTNLIPHFTVERPFAFLPINFIPGEKNELKWYSAKDGRRYQITVRFHYLESLKSDTSVKAFKSVDWIIFNNIRTMTNLGGEIMDYYYPCDGFYANLGARIPVDYNLNRVARSIDFIFSVASDDLNTYMEVTSPSLGIIQERPSFTNINNGIGIFSSRTQVWIDSLGIRQETVNQLRVNEYTKNLGF